MLTKQKIIKDKARIRSNSGKLTNWLDSAGTSAQPVIINEDATDPIVIREEEDDEQMNLADIPEVDVEQKTSRRSARTKNTEQDPYLDASDLSDSEGSDLFVSGGRPRPPGPRRRPGNTGEGVEDMEPQDDKKKFGLNTSYDGFSIYGRILCLVVKRRGTRSQGSGQGASQAMLENWVSTQAAAEQVDDDE